MCRGTKLWAKLPGLNTCKGGLLPSMATGCIRDIHVPHPSAGEAVQIAVLPICQAIPAGMTGLNYRFG